MRTISSTVYVGPKVPLNTIKKVPRNSRAPGGTIRYGIHCDFEGNEWIEGEYDPIYTKPTPRFFDKGVEFFPTEDITL